MWVVTRSHNDYDQHGEYFVAVFKKKPDFAALKKLFPDSSDEVVGKLTRGGGRDNTEDIWHDLIEVEPGKHY